MKNITAATIVVFFLPILVAAATSLEPIDLSTAAATMTVPVFLPNTEKNSPGADLPLIVSSKEWKGFRCGIMEPRSLIVRDELRWNNFWQSQMAPYERRNQKTPEVDFSKEMIIGVFHGEEPYPATEIEIVSMKVVSSELIVRYKKTEHMIGMATTPLQVQPYHLKKITAFTGPVRFVEN